MNEQRLIYGLHAVAEALASLPVASAGTLWLSVSRRDRAVANLLELARERELRVREVSREAIERMAPGAVHQGVLLEAEAFCYVDLESILQQAQAQPNGIVLVLDEVQDPHNLGALIRTALAFGVLGVVIPKDRSAGINATAIKASAGAALHMPVARVSNLARSLDQLKDAGFWVHGAAGEAPIRAETVDWTGRVALVMGAEGHGLRRLTRERCDSLVRLEHDARMSSLNVSVAGGILLYLIARAQQDGSG